MASNPKLPARITNSALARARYEDELEWMRPSDFLDHDLPRPIVLINGAFDLLHVGHMKIIAKARERAGQNGTVVCAMDSDAKVARAKGDGRPIMSWIERAAALNYQPINFLVEIEERSDMDELVSALSPDLRVQGYDYLDHQSAYPHIPKLFVRGTPMRTSEIVKRCQNLKT
jgi:cytidyltransferase-like protein